MRQADDKTSLPASPGALRGKHPQPAQRALAEAEERRRLKSLVEIGAPKETGGRGGLDPARYGDWEIKGIVSDF